MLYAPHILQVKTVSASTVDEYGRVTKGTETWEKIGSCRCDDVSGEKKMSVNGSLYDFKYKVVFDKALGSVDAGTEVRCLDTDGNIRGEGVAKSPLKTNYLPYRVIWLE